MTFTFERGGSDHMNYSQQEFFDLMEAVEDQGGEHLDKLCKSKLYNFVGKHQKPVRLPSCGHSALFHVPYDHGEGGTAEKRTIEACAVDDDMGRWPRFGGDRFAGPEHYIKPKDSD